MPMGAEPSPTTPPNTVPTTTPVQRERYNSCRTQASGLHPAESSAHRFLQGRGGERGGPPARRNAASNRAPTSPRLPPPPASARGLQARSKQVSAAGTEARRPPRRLPRSRARPGQGRVARGPRGRESRGRRARVSGRTGRRGSARPPPARPPPPPAEQRAPGGSGVKSTSSRSFPHAAPRERSLHTRARTRTARSLPREKRESGPGAGGAQCANSGRGFPDSGGRGRREASPVRPAQRPGHSASGIPRAHPAARAGGSALRLTSRAPGRGSAEGCGEDSAPGRRGEPRHARPRRGAGGPQQSPRILQ